MSTFWDKLKQAASESPQGFSDPDVQKLIPKRAPLQESSKQSEKLLTNQSAVTFLESMLPANVLQSAPMQSNSNLTEWRSQLKILPAGVSLFYRESFAGFVGLGADDFAETALDVRWTQPNDIPNYTYGLIIEKIPDNQVLVIQEWTPYLLKQTEEATNKWALLNTVEYPRVLVATLQISTGGWDGNVKAYLNSSAVTPVVAVPGIARQQDNGFTQSTSIFNTRALAEQTPYNIVGAPGARLYGTIKSKVSGSPLWTDVLMGGMRVLGVLVPVSLYQQLQGGQ